MLVCKFPRWWKSIRLWILLSGLFGFFMGIMATFYSLKEFRINNLEIVIKQEQKNAMKSLELVGRMNEIIKYSSIFDIGADKARIIFDIAKEEKIMPIILFGICNQETGFNVLAIGNKGEIGIAQIMPATGKEYYPDIKSSQLFDIRLNLRIAAKHLKKLIGFYGTEVGIAMYNMGEGKFQGLIRQGKNPWFNKRYVEQVLLPKNMTLPLLEEEDNQ